jgi:hypothetical protein
MDGNSTDAAVQLARLSGTRQTEWVAVGRLLSDAC